MQRYKRGKEIKDHSLPTVFNRYDSKQETEFVKAFFGQEEANSILETCGIPLVEEYDPQPEYPVQIGYSTKRADLVFEGPDDTVFYFEVMSQSYDGRWDDAHHQQFYLKSTRLSQEYENVYAFAVAFKEFEPKYLEEISKMDNWYAIHLRFNDHGYFPEVYGVEQKRQKEQVKNLEKEDFGFQLLGIASGFGWKNRGDRPMSSNYLFVGKGFEGKKYRGIEWVISSKKDRFGIKLHGAMYKEEPWRSVNKEPEKIMVFIQEKVPEVKFFPLPERRSEGERDTAFYFEFDKSNLTDESIQMLKEITEAFGEAFGLSELLETTKQKKEPSNKEVEALQ
jgi:hypothetical protein